MNKKKLIRVTTVPLSFDKLLGGQMNFMNSHYDVTAVSSEEDYLKEIGIKEQVKTLTLRLTRKITPLRDVIAVFRLYLFLKKEKPFIIHSHTPKAGIVAMLAGKLANTPNRLHTVAGLPLLEARGLKRILLNKVEKLTYACATNVYPNSNQLLRIILENNFLPNGKAKVIGNGSSNGIDTTFFDTAQIADQKLLELKKELKISDTDFVFIFVGRLVSDKGINELVSSFLKLYRNKLQFKLLLVGPYEDELDPLLPNTKTEIKRNINIITTGYINDVRPFFAISEALVFPSYREGFPNVVMQAGAMGLPSIVTNINGCNEIIIQNKNGLIIETKNEEQLYLAMENLASNVKLFNSLKSNARRLILERFEQNFLWNKLLEEYKNLE
ncbi:MAG: glycosyltransferase family 4 protein [Flaviramulus sp.]|nr:glycosyltransferase family 4 protein [Flaviramulus sp.]